MSWGSATLPKDVAQCSNVNSTKVVSSINLKCKGEVPMSKTETTKPSSDSEKKKNILVGVINLAAALMTKGHLHHYTNPVMD